MNESVSLTQEEKVMAGLAHGSIVLGLFTNGVGGLIGALVIWILQREKSAFAAAQALQSLVYQALTFAITMVFWCCWGMVYMLLIFPPIIANPEAYETTVPAGLWIGLALMIIPFAVWGITILYGLYGAVRSYGGHDFKYAILGKWLENQHL